MEFMKLPQGKIFITDDREILQLSPSIPKEIERQLIDNQNGILINNFLNQSISLYDFGHIEILPVIPYKLNHFEILNFYRKKTFIIV